MAAVVAAAGISACVARALYMKKHIVAYGYAKIVLRRIMDGRIRRTEHVQKQDDTEVDASESGDDEDDEGLPPNDCLSAPEDEPSNDARVPHPFRNSATDASCDGIRPK